MQGELRDELELGSHGVAGDRRYGVFDVGSSTVISAKRDGRLLGASATLGVEGLIVTLPDGQVLPPGVVLDEQLSTWLGRPVWLADATNLGPATFECPDDFEDDESPSVQWQGIESSFVDESELHLLSTGDLEQLRTERGDVTWDVRRFRPNVVIDASADEFSSTVATGRYVLGDAEIEIYKACSRCVMTTRAQPGGLARELDVLRHVSRLRGGNLGVRARVTRSGVVRVGDVVTPEL